VCARGDDGKVAGDPWWEAAAEAEGVLAGGAATMGDHRESRTRNQLLP